MSKNSESKIANYVINDLGKSGYRLIRLHGPFESGIDLLATKDQCLFAIQIKARPLETFDIISGSTISTSKIQNVIKGQPEYQDKTVKPVLISGSIIPESSVEFANQMGVIVTSYDKVVDNLENACRKERKKDK